MFTGIVDHTGVIQAIETTAKGKKFAIGHQFCDLQLGESIAVDGACLTVVEFDEQKFSVELSPETLRLTIAGNYKINDRVNLERALKMGDRLGGHWVTGHIDQTVKIAAINSFDEYSELIFSGLAKKEHNLLVKKGSVTINGVSLTINELTADGFAIMMIPHTAAVTNLSELKIADRVNIEFDHMAKIICQQVNHFLENQKMGELA